MMSSVFLLANGGVFCCLGLHHCSRPGAEQFPVPPGVSGLLLQFMREPLHVHVVFKCTKEHN